MLSEAIQTRFCVCVCFVCASCFSLCSVSGVHKINERSALAVSSAAPPL